MGEVVVKRPHARSKGLISHFRLNLLDAGFEKSSWQTAFFKPIHTIN